MRRTCEWGALLPRQALSQCDGYLTRMGVIKEAVDDTAGAAKTIALKSLKRAPGSSRPRSTVACLGCRCLSCCCYCPVGYLGRCLCWQLLPAQAPAPLLSSGAV